MLNSSPPLFHIPATRPPGLSGGNSIRSLQLTIRYPASLLILFRRLLKTAAIILPQGQMTSLQNPGPPGLQYLSHLFKLSINDCNIPVIWKHAIINPVPKSNKPADFCTSYRSISLLCPAVKVFERLLQAELKSFSLLPNEHGFRPNHSTVCGLLPLAHKPAQGFYQPWPPLCTLILPKLLTWSTISNSSGHSPSPL